MTDCWESIEWEHLPKSLKVDFGRYLLNHKPALRFCFHPVHIAINAFSNVKFPGCLRVFRDIVYIARNPFEISRLVNTDNDIYPHEISLGDMLGYPMCCAEKIRVIGESNIDIYNRNFNLAVEKFSMLDITLYSHGIGLISHVPCSINCKASLKQATQFYQLLKVTDGSEKFRVWRDEVVSYFSKNADNTSYAYEYLP